METIHIIDVGGAHELATVELLHQERYCEQMGVEVRRIWVANGGDAVRLLLEGQADAAIQTGFGPALAAIAKGAPLKVIAGANLLTVHAIYSKQPDIRRLADLPGRTVGVGALGALTHQLVVAALLKHRINPAKVRFIPIGNSAIIFEALLAGEVEAGFGETDVFDNQAEYGVHALDDAVLWRELPAFPNQASFAPQAVIARKREALIRVLAAHALLYRRLHDPDGVDAYARAWAAGLPHAPAREGASQWRFYQDYHPFAADLLLPPAQVVYLQELNMRMGLQSEALAFEAVADLSLAREAIRRLDSARVAS